MNKKPELLSSAPSLAQIMEAISDFYCGCAKTLEPAGPDLWALHDARGPLGGVQVRKVKSRYRFEALD